MMDNRATFLFALVMAALMVIAGCDAEMPDVKSFENDTDPYYYQDSDPEDVPTDPNEETDGDTGEDERWFKSCFAEDFEGSGPPEGEGADVGEACERTADCRLPLLCIADVCAAPGPREEYCDGEGVLCPDEGQECINFQCVNLDAGCRSSVDCPAGYECVVPDGEWFFIHRCRPADEECTVDADCEQGQICDFGACVTQNMCMTTSDLRGNYRATSVLQLGMASEGAIGGIVDATQWLRDLLQGGGMFPGLSEIISGLIRDFLFYNIQDYQIDVILSLIDISDILNDIRIEHQMSLDGSCSEMYRGELTFEQIELTYKDQVFIERFENIPAIGALPPAEFGATLQCRKLAFDEIYVDYIAAGVVRHATDVLVQTITSGRFKHLEGVLTSMIDCNAISNYVSMAIGNPLIGIIVQPACSLVAKNLIRNVTKSMSDNQSAVGWLKLQGEAEVVGGGNLEGGTWFGTTLTGGVYGEITATKL